MAAKDDGRADEPREARPAVSLGIPKAKVAKESPALDETERAKFQKAKSGILQNQQRSAPKPLAADPEIRRAMGASMRSLHRQASMSLGKEVEEVVPEPPQEDIEELRDVSYREGFLKAGGPSEVARLKDLSLSLERQITGGSVLQEAEFSLLKLPVLYDHAATIEQAFADLGEYMCRIMGENVTWKKGPRKEEKRAKEKVLMKYGGDTTRLTDILRGTFVFHGSETTTELEDLYNGVQKLLDSDLKSSASFRWIEFGDKFRRHGDQGYRDVQILVSLLEHVCELQFSVASIDDLKTKGGGHKKYQVARQVNETLLECAVNGNDLELMKTLEHRYADPNNAADLHNKRAIFFAACRGEPRHVKALIEAKADLFCTDSHNRLPLIRAVINEVAATQMIHTSPEPDDDHDLPIDPIHLEVSELLLERMMTLLVMSEKSDPHHLIISKLGMNQRALDELFTVTAIAAENVMSHWKGFSWLFEVSTQMSMHSAQGSTMLHSWARHGWLVALNKVFDVVTYRSMMLQFVNAKVYTGGHTPADVAAMKGSDHVEVVQLLLEHKSEVTITRKKMGPKVRELLGIDAHEDDSDDDEQSMTRSMSDKSDPHHP